MFGRRFLFKILAIWGFAPKVAISASAAVEPPLPDRRIPVMKIGRWYHTKEGPMLSIEGTRYVHWSEIPTFEIQPVELGDPRELIEEYVRQKVRDETPEGGSRPAWATIYQWRSEIAARIQARRDKWREEYRQFKADRDIGGMLLPEIREKNDGRPAPVYDEAGNVISPDSLKPGAPDPNQAEYDRQWAEAEERYQQRMQQLRDGRRLNGDPA